MCSMESIFLGHKAGKKSSKGPTDTSTHKALDRS